MFTEDDPSGIDAGSEVGSNDLTEVWRAVIDLVSETIVAFRFGMVMACAFS